MTELYFVGEKTDGIIKGYFTEDYRMASKFVESEEDIVEISMDGDVSLESVIKYFKEEKIDFEKLGENKKTILKIPDVSVLKSFFEA